MPRRSEVTRCTSPQRNNDFNIFRKEAELSGKFNRKASMRCAHVNKMDLIDAATSVSTREAEITNLRRRENAHELPIKQARAIRLIVI